MRNIVEKAKPERVASTIQRQIVKAAYKIYCFSKKKTQRQQFNIKILSSLLNDVNEIEIKELHHKLRILQMSSLEVNDKVSELLVEGNSHACNLFGKIRVDN
jgi:hypothetical protein